MLIFILGLMIGSFLNVCICRIPNDESIIMPPSHCRQCKAPISWYDNIPVLSYLILKGRCRHCKRVISAQYIIVEILTAILITAAFFKYGLTLHFVMYSMLFCLLIIATFIDFKYQVIPDTITVFGIAAGFLFNLLNVPSHNWYAGLLNSLSGITAGAVSIYLIMKLGTIIFKRKLQRIGEEEAMGFGDVTLMAMIGAFLGYKYTLLVFFMAPFFGSVVGIALKLKYKQDIMPYGPYLSLAAVVAVFFGDSILKLLM
ncbi:MAG: prepilin peptidase [Candidatus Omnitrophica bacterium]|nr:prepilin peptidase [Candidatus Omnitrophota bacterium]